MASITLLSSIINNQILESIEQTLETTTGSIISKKLLNTILGTNTAIKTKYNARLENLNVQTSTYGRMIPIVYGTMRIAGNIIWAQPIREVIHENISVNNSSKSGNINQVTYQYYATLAIAICTGVVSKILKVWANNKILNLQEINYRFYHGTEDQEPDPLITKIEGNSPAYRGLSYIVIEDFDLTNYGNHIPSFTFEVCSYPENYCSQEHVTKKIQAIHIIPGFGEFTYDTETHMKVLQEKIAGQYIPYGTATRINNYNGHPNKTDAILSLDQLQKTLPNIKWVSVVVNWYANSLDVQNCNIYPAVEFTDEAKIIPDDWSVAGIPRISAKVILKDENGKNNCRGTINDTSLIRYLKELKNRGYKTLLYPMILMDTPNKSWVGEITGNAQNILYFFNNEYNRFIKHYCNMCKGIVDAFVIGSTLSGITKVKDENGNYPGVDELNKLAHYVKNILGTSTIVTYAANWNEFHSYLNEYNMDKLWSSHSIDVVGINAYFPLTDSPQPNGGFTVQNIIDSWTSGEGYDYFYSNNNIEKQLYNNNNKKYAWKNIHLWWSTEHINPDGKPTSWKRKMKKIWFSSYGFPSIDNCTNQPDTLITYNSSNDKYPKLSQGNVDFNAQRIAIEGTIEKWKDSTMVEQMFLWGWDVRPYPYFPDLHNIWHDAQNWQIGHWIQGKISLLGISDVVNDLLIKSKIKQKNFDAQNIQGLVEGYVINHRASTKDLLNNLRNAYFFDIVEQDNKITFINLGKNQEFEIPINDIVHTTRSNNFHDIINITKINNSTLTDKIDLLYLSRAKDYQINLKYAQLNSGFNKETIEIPLILQENHAQNIVNTVLYKTITENQIFSFILPIKYIWLNISDIIKISYNQQTYIIRITNITLNNISIHVEGVNYCSEIYSHIFPPNKITLIKPTAIIPNIENTEIKIIDLPCLYDNRESLLHFSVNNSGENWKGAAIFVSEDDGQNYKMLSSAKLKTTEGIAVNKLNSGPIAIPDKGNNITVILNQGSLSSIDKLSLLSGQNLALIGNEIIQFRDAKLIDNNKYRLRYLLRGRFGTEQYVNQHQLGEPFTLLDQSLLSIKINSSFIGRSLLYQAVSYGQTLNNSQNLKYKYNARSLKPLSVVHIKGERDIEGNLTISWIRRARINAQWLDNVDVPLDEKFEQYEIYIIHPSNEIIRSIIIKDRTSFLYSKEMQKSDFGTVQDNIKIAIYQISAMIGKGDEIIVSI